MNALGVILSIAAWGAEPAPIDFPTQVVPVLSRAGCNAGNCHGAAAGRGGFRLSLWGSDPESDYRTIVHELEGRRVNLFQPERSLLLRKPTGQLEHGGQDRFDIDSASAAVLRQWIAAGAPRGGDRQLEQFEVTPRAAVVSAPGTTLRLMARARFGDGTVDDVTPWTVFASLDESAVHIDAGAATARIQRRGQHTVLARFLDRVVPLRLVCPLGEMPVDHADQPRANFIDEHVLRTLSTLQLEPAPPADDAALLRRTTLDLTGRLPTPDEVQAYLSDESPGKRSALVERLLASSAFVEYWTWKLAGLLEMQNVSGDGAALAAYRGWLRAQVRDGASWRETTRSVLTATGDSHLVGPASFLRGPGDARTLAERVGRTLMGIRLGCANCHPHPLDRWTQDDYHGLAAVFATLDRGRFVVPRGYGSVTHPRTGQPAMPRIPGHRDLDENTNGRLALADWLTEADNPYLARALTNRLWQSLLGRGLIEPVDDLRDTNPATHPELLAELAADFVEHGCDLRHVLRQIVSSQAYARGVHATPPGAADNPFYSHATSRPLPAEVLADALADVTGVFDRYADQPPGTRAVALVDPATPAPGLDLLGRCARRLPCQADPSGGGLPGRLHLLNGSLVNDKISAPNGRLHQLLADGKTNEQIVAEFYVRGLGRWPTSAEQAWWNERLTAATATERTAVLEDFLWSLLNSRAFTTNH